MTHRFSYTLVAFMVAAFSFPGLLPAQQPTPVAPVATAPAAAATSLAEAIRERVDHLRYEQQQDVRGARVVMDELVAQLRSQM